MKHFYPAVTGTLITLGVFSSCVPAPRIHITEKTDLPDFHTKSQATNQNRQLSLSSIAARVKANHPQLRAARLTINEAKGRISQAGRLQNPTLGISIAKSIPSSEGDLEVSFNQRFPVTNKLALEKRISGQALLIAREEIKVAEHQLVSAAQLVAVEIMGSRQQANHISKQITALKSIAEFIEEAASRGELSPLDASQTRLQIEAL